MNTLEQFQQDATDAQASLSAYAVARANWAKAADVAYAALDSCAKAKAKAEAETEAAWTAYTQARAAYAKAKAKGQAGS